MIYVKCNTDPKMRIFQLFSEVSRNRKESWKLNKIIVNVLNENRKSVAQNNTELISKFSSCCANQVGFIC